MVSLLHVSLLSLLVLPLLLAFWLLPCLCLRALCLAYFSRAARFLGAASVLPVRFMLLLLLHAFSFSLGSVCVRVVLSEDPNHLHALLCCTLSCLFCSCDLCVLSCHCYLIQTASAGYIHPSRAMQLGHLTGSAAPPPMPSMPTHSAPAAPLISGPGGGPINPALASIMGNLQNILPGLMQNVGASAATANPATRQARRLYVGNLPMPISDAELRIFMSEAYKRANPGHTPGEPVISVYLNMEKKFGFVEFRTPEEATTGLALDGIQMRGQVLKVRRPSDYVPPPGAAPAPMSAYNTAPGVISTQVPDGPNKVFAGGLPYTLTENEIKELLGTFGTLRAFHLVKDRDTNTSKGYCFFEYADPNVTDGAIAGLNNIKIGDKTLTVRRAVPKK